MFRPQMFQRIVLLIVLIGNSVGCSVPDTTPIQQWRHVEEGAYAADISTDGTLAVVSGVNNGVNVWRMGQSEPLYHWSHQGEGDNLVMSVHISADKSYVVTADREAFALWSLETGEPEGFGASTSHQLEMWWLPIMVTAYWWRAQMAKLCTLNLVLRVD